MRNLSMLRVSALVLLLGSSAFGFQDPPDKIRLQLKGKVDLATLVPLFAKELGLRIVYDSALLEGKQVSIAAPSTLSRKEVRDLLEDALAAHALVLETSTRPGLHRIVQRDSARRELKIYRPLNTDAKELHTAAAAVYASAEGETAEVSLTLDEATNSIVILASPGRTKEVLEFLKAMDRKRLQVLIEVIVLSVDDVDDLIYGTDAWETGTDSSGGVDRILGQLFGLTSVSASPFSATPNLPTGFNAVVLKPRDISFSMRLLQNTNKAKVLAAPKVLVRDNAQGEIQSISEQPFSSINATNTVATTSFDEYATAGPQLKVTPHISEGDQLLLEYEITLSNFTGPAPSAELPPPRKTDKVTSKIVIPDGHAVVVGGLKFTRDNEITDKIPILGDIPVIGELFKSTQKIKSETRLFVFIRPQILRDDQFLDLKNLTERDMKLGGIAPGGIRPNPSRIMKR